MTSKIILPFSLLILLLALKPYAQNLTDTFIIHIETTDGNEFLGEIIGQDSIKIYLQTQNLGEISIFKRDIKYQEKIQPQQIRKGKLWFANPQSTRHFWSPNSYGLKKGEGYYQNIWVLWNQLAYGVTDNFSVGGAVVPLFLFGGEATPVFISPKFSIPVTKDKFNIGGGAIIGTVLGESETGFGIVYGLSTFGSPDNNVTVGIGYGFSGDKWTSSPIINISGIFRISNRGYFITENYYLGIADENSALISLGGRWIIKKAALDFGLFFPVFDIDEFIALPWLGFSIPFGKTN